MATLEQLLNEEDSIFSLKKKLEEEGHRFRSFKDYEQFLEREWWKIVWPKLKQPIDNLADDPAIPCRIVSIDGVAYHLHGLHHGDTFMPILPEENRIVCDMAKSVHLPRKGIDYLYEQFLYTRYDFLRSQELLDHFCNHPNFYYRFLKGICILPLAIPAAIIGLLISLLINPLSRFVKEPTSFPDGLIYINNRLKNTRYRSFNLARAYSMIEMPQPFGLELSHLTDKSSIMRYLADVDLDSPTTVERSLWMSKELREYAKKKGLRELHYFCGMAHVSHIEFFLRNPNYKIEDIEIINKRKLISL